MLSLLQIPDTILSILIYLPLRFEKNLLKTCIMLAKEISKIEHNANFWKRKYETIFDLPNFSIIEDLFDRYGFMMSILGDDDNAMFYWKQKYLNREHDIITDLKYSDIVSTLTVIIHSEKFKLTIGKLGLKCLYSDIINSKQISSFIKVIARYCKRQYKLLIYCFPNIALTAKSISVRMGKGIGSILD